MSNPETRKIELSIDRKANACYLQIAKHIGEGESVSNENFEMRSHSAELVLDFDRAGRLLGIEIIGIDGLLPDELS